MTRRADQRRGARAASSATAAGAARSTPACKALRDRYADLIRERYPDIPRRVSGYNLDELLPENGFNVARALVGTEGTCVTILEATVRLVYSPPSRERSLVLGYPDVYQRRRPRARGARSTGRSASRASTTGWSRT